MRSSVRLPLADRAQSDSPSATASVWRGSVTLADRCAYCRRGQENLCDAPGFTGYTIDGGYADFTVADENFCFRIPTEYDSTAAAPLLCAGLIGYRSLVMAGPGGCLGIFGFGAAAHIVAQVARASGAAGLCLYPARRCEGPAICQRHGSRMGRRLGIAVPGGARCGDHLCPCRSIGARRRCARSAREALWCAAGSTCRRFRASITASYGAKGYCAASPI